MSARQGMRRAAVSKGFGQRCAHVRSASKALVDLRLVPALL